MDNFAIFIITYKRPDNQVSYDTLRNHNYTGKIYFVVDDSDPTIEELRKNFVEKDSNSDILIFSKVEIAKITDTGMAKPYLNFSVFPRNAAEEFAKELNLEYFAILEDDMKYFDIRILEDNTLKRYKVRDCDYMIEQLIEFMKSDDRIAMLSPAQTLMFFNKNIYEESYMQKYREVATFIFRKTKIPVSWGLNMLEDVITSFKVSRMGYISTIIPELQSVCVRSYGKVPGGNSDTYNSTKHVDSIFPIVAFPDAMVAHIAEDYVSSRAISQNYLCPMIVSSSFRKS